MTEEKIKRLEELEVKATSKPWLNGGPYPGVSVLVSNDEEEYIPIAIIDQKTKGDSNPSSIADGEFITDFRNHAKELLQSARENIRLRKALGDIKASALGLRCENKCPGLFIFMVEKALNDQEGK